MINSALLRRFTPRSVAIASVIGRVIYKYFQGRSATTATTARKSSTKSSAAKGTRKGKTTRRKATGKTMEPRTAF